MWTARVPRSFNSALFAALLSLAACETDQLPAPEPGGALSAAGPIHLSQALTPAQRLQHSRGASFFQKPWVSAPSTTFDRDGLGPLFNAHSCASCHPRFGRGKLANTPAHDHVNLIFRTTGSHPLGEQIQTRVIPGFSAEAQVELSHQTEIRQLADGTRVSLRKPRYQLAGEKQLHLSPRLAPAVTGMGLIDALPDSDILAGADPNDRNGDGISGRAPLREGRPGRFGWKAEQPSLRAQVAKAFSEDIGITSNLFPEENRPPDCDAACTFASGGSPEIDDDGIEAVASYLSMLSVPKSRMTKAHRRGWNLFKRAGCHQCHQPSWRTGPHDNPLLSRQQVFPFSDFLLHDLGEGLADSGSTPLAREWRTAPLWNLGPGPYLHDGRATSLLEAILWHEGEARAARDHVLQFSGSERTALLEFLLAL